MEKRDAIGANGFTISHNEGSFLDEPWLIDVGTGKEWRYDKVPRAVRRQFAQWLRNKGKMSPGEASLLVSFVIDY